MADKTRSENIKSDGLVGVDYSKKRMIGGVECVPVRIKAVGWMTTKKADFLVDAAIMLTECAEEGASSIKDDGDELTWGKDD